MNKQLLDSAEPSDGVTDHLNALQWQVGNMAISKTHFYMTYNDPKEGLTVSWHNKITGSADKRHGFKDKDEANEWIEKTHHAQKHEQYQNRAQLADFKVGQQWVHFKMHTVLLEILDVDDTGVYAKIYSSTNTDNTSGAIAYSIHEFQHFIENDYLAIFDGETIADCLLRNGGK